MSLRDVCARWRDASPPPFLLAFCRDNSQQRRVETWRHESKVQRYGQIYEEVRALRKETRHSVQDLRERFKEKGVIQNKDQFIVKLIAQVGDASSRPFDWLSALGVGLQVMYLVMRFSHV